MIVVQIYTYIALLLQIIVLQIRLWILVRFKGTIKQSNSSHFIEIKQPRAPVSEDFLWTALAANISPENLQRAGGGGLKKYSTAWTQHLDVPVPNFLSLPRNSLNNEYLNP